MSHALVTAALRAALHERSIYRSMALAGLDELVIAMRTIDTQRRQIQEMREERERYARDIFQRTAADE